MADSVMTDDERDQAQALSEAIQRLCLEADNPNVVVSGLLGALFGAARDGGFLPDRVMVNILHGFIQSGLDEDQLRTTLTIALARMIGMGLITGRTT